MECKDTMQNEIQEIKAVLMEPKWNVKKIRQLTQAQVIGINGTKVECKEICCRKSVFTVYGINGTKVECKDDKMYKAYNTPIVLMEPKWNVKSSSLSSSVRLSSY